MRNIEGIICNPKLANGKSGAEFEFSDSGARVNINGQRYSINYSTMMVSTGGAGNKYIFINSKLDRELCFYFHVSSGILEILQSSNNDELMNIANKYKKKSLITYFVTAVTLITMIFVGYQLYSARKVITGKLANFIPYSAEKTIGDHLINTIILDSTIIKDDSINKEFQKLMNIYLNQANKNIDHFKFYISKDTEINAFALPGGHIVFNIGMLKETSKAEDILGVLAHEITHVEKRHILQSLFENAGLFVVVQTVAGDVSGLLALILNQGSTLIHRGFSREIEQEADDVAFDTLVSSKISPLGLSRFFQTLLNKEGEKSSKSNEISKNMLKFLGTHPDLKHRISNIQNKFDALPRRVKGQITPVDFDFKKFKTLLKQY